MTHRALRVLDRIRRTPTLFSLDRAGVAYLGLWLLAALTLFALLHTGCSNARDQHLRQALLAETTDAPATPPGPQAPGGSVYADQLRSLGYFGGTEHDTEQYDAVEAQGFRAVARHPLSTFSVDVDTASYANVRRLLRSGRLPPAGAVRIEELINYFSYEQPEADTEHPFSLALEVAHAPWKRDHRLVRIHLQGMHVAPAAVPPRNLTFLLDVSGSMQTPGKLSLVKRALTELTRQLRPQDHVSIVVYAGASGLVLPPTSGADPQPIVDALAHLQAGGSTNGGEGIRLAYATARRHYDAAGVNRVLLATDGDWNVGTTNRSDLVDLIERERESGVFLTVLGVGTGNLKDATMEELADKGNGNYAYLDDLAEARKVLIEESGGTLHTIAKDVKIQVEWNPDRVLAYRLIGYENRRLADEDFNDDSKDAGEIGAGHDVTALYEVVPTGVDAAPLRDVDPLRYQRPAERRPNTATSQELLTVKVRYKQPDSARSTLVTRHLLDDPEEARAASENLRFAAAVASFGMLLRDSEHLGDASFAMVADLARGAAGSDPGGYRGEFVRLVEIARGLSADAGAHEPVARAR